MSSFTDNLESLNLTRNPFDPAPLEASEKDMRLFVGRNEEIEQLKTILTSIPNGLCRVVVMGAYGVGKTSFVNRVFWEAQKFQKWRFATIKLIAKEDMTFLNFLLSLLYKFVDILLANDLDKKQRKLVEEIKLNLDFERQVGIESSSEITGTLNAVIASLAGKLGVKESEIRKPHPWTERSALRDLNAIIDLVLKFYDGIVLGIDEVDYLASRKSMEVLKKGREEIFQKRNFLFVFSGTLRFRMLLDKIGSPVREIIDKFVILGPFRYPEERNILNELVNLRLKNASKRGMTYKNPFDKDSMELVFTLSGGVPRRILRFFQISMDTGLSVSKIVKTTTVLNAIRELGKGHYVGLPMKERAIIKLLARKESIREEDFEEVRNKFKLSEEGERKVRNLLESQGLLSTNFVGRETIYALAPELRVYVLHESKLATPVLQIEAAQKLRQTIPDEKDKKAKTTYQKYANLLESQGHLGLLKIEYDQMSNNERISHCEKTVRCIRGLTDSKLRGIVRIISGALEKIKEAPASHKAIKKDLVKAEGNLRDYANSVFEPSKGPSPEMVLVGPGREYSIHFRDLDEMRFRDVVFYEAAMRERIKRESMHRRVIVRRKKQLPKKEKKKKRGFFARLLGRH